MPYFGSFALLLALVFSVYALVAGVVSLSGRSRPATAELLGETARRAGIAVFIAIFGASLALVWAAFTDNVCVSYILRHSNRDLAAPYKCAVLWAGQEGSLLFWALLLSAYGFVVHVRHKVDVRLVAHASVVIAAV